ncbi:hypothetical protein OSTOST_15980 [Ostertagia ostertagi]
MKRLNLNLKSCKANSINTSGIRAKRREKHSFLRVPNFLAVTDFLSATATIPYAIYLTSHWRPTHIDLDQHYVLILSTPLPVQLKINLVLATSVALERNLALFLPASYRRLPSSIYATASLVIGLLFAAVDLVLEFSLPSWPSQHNSCAALWCFLSRTFQYYWGTSNLVKNFSFQYSLIYLRILVLSFVVLALTSLFLIKLRTFQRKPRALQTCTTKESKKFQQANRISTGILLTSMIFVTCPSIALNIFAFRGGSKFEFIGPFYLIGLLCTGTFSSVLYMILYQDMRKLVKAYLTCKCPRVESMGSSVSSNGVFYNTRF